MNHTSGLLAIIIIIIIINAIFAARNRRARGRVLKRVKRAHNRPISNTPAKPAAAATVIVIVVVVVHVT